MKILRVILLVITALMVSSCYTNGYYVRKPYPMKILVPSCVVYANDWRLVGPFWGYNGSLFYPRSLYYDDCGVWYNGYWRRPMVWRYPTGHPQPEPFRGVRQPVRPPEARPHEPRQPDRRPEVRQPEPRQRQPDRQPETRQPESRRPEPRQPEARPQQPQKPSNPPSSGRRRPNDS